jgi:hypothetical protein
MGKNNYWRQNVMKTSYREKKKEVQTNDNLHGYVGADDVISQLTELNNRLLKENQNKRKELAKRNDFMDWKPTRALYRVYRFFHKKDLETPKSLV